MKIDNTRQKLEKKARHITNQSQQVIIKTIKVSELLKDAEQEKTNIKINKFLRNKTNCEQKEQQTKKEMNQENENQKIENNNIFSKNIIHNEQLSGEADSPAEEILKSSKEKNNIKRLVNNIHFDNIKTKSYGCKHYKRKCLILFNCCNKLYECRICHNRIEDHKCQREEINILMCLVCGKIQNFSQQCEYCEIEFAEYICMRCKLLSSNHNTFHCFECKVCRKGKKEDYFHCMQCNACLPVGIKEYHLIQNNEDGNQNKNKIISQTHVENTLFSTCPICAQDLFYSTSHVVLMHCGHSIHKRCFISYKNKSFQCPICLKSSSDNKTVNERIDFVLNQCQDLNTSKNINAYECVTSCFDCQAKFTAKYTYLYNKCMGCGSYNTRINELYKRDE